MTERPILFSAPMVRALLDGTKRQTRRALKRQPPAETVVVGTYHHPDPRPHFYALVPNADKTSVLKNEISEWEPMPCPYSQPGDRPWVRETFQRHPLKDGAFVYRASARGETVFDSWKPSIHMPRKVSRITLEVTGVRVERLQDISADDARAEGCPDKAVAGAEQASVDLLAQIWYHDLWEQINGPGSWAANPWVWVVEFKRV